MENLNYEETFHLADTSVQEMFPQEQNVKSKSPVAKIKEKHENNKRLTDYKQKVLDRYEVAGIIHNEKHSTAIPRMGMKPGVLYLNPMLAFIVEGKLEDHLLRIQGRLS